MGYMRFVSLLDEERARRAREVFADGLIPVLPEQIVALTPRGPEPEPCWLLDVERLTDAQREAIAQQYGPSHGLSVEEARAELAQRGMPIPVENTIMISLEGAVGV